MRVFSDNHIDKLVGNASIISSNGFGNQFHKDILAVFKQANIFLTPLVGGEVIARSPFEKMVADFLLVPDFEYLTNEFSLVIKDFTKEFPHFNERFKSLTFNLGRGLTVEQKLKASATGGFTTEAIEFESELTSVYGKITELRQALSSDSYISSCITKSELSSFNTAKAADAIVPHSKESHAILKAVFVETMEMYLSLFEDTAEKRNLQRALNLAFDFAAAADDDIYLLNGITNSSIVDSIAPLKPFIKPVDHYRQHVLLHATNGFFDISVYLKFFFTALQNGLSDFNQQVLLPTQYVFHSVVKNMDNLFIPEHSVEDLAFFVAATLHYDRLLKRVSLGAGDKLMHSIKTHGAYGAFSLEARM